MVVCLLSSLLLLSLLYRYKGTELFQNGKHSKDISYYFRKINFFEQYMQLEDCHNVIFWNNIQ